MGIVPDFPGIIPAAINEASEILQQLNKPFWTVVDFEYNEKGLVSRMTTKEVTPLLLIMAVSAPAMVVATMKIIEAAAGAGKALGGVDPGAAQGIVTEVIKKSLPSDTIFDIFGAIWKLTTRITLPGIP